MYPNIEAERARKRMSQLEMSVYLGVSLKTFQNWTFGKTAIPSTALKNMSILFGKSIDYLLDDTNQTAS